MSKIKDTFTNLSRYVYDELWIYHPRETHFEDFPSDNVNTFYIYDGFIIDIYNIFLLYMYALYVAFVGLDQADEQDLADHIL